MKHCDLFGTGHWFRIWVKVNRSDFVFPHRCINAVYFLLYSWWFWGILIVDDKVERILCVSWISVTSCHQLSNTVQRYTTSIVLHLHQWAELQRSFMVTRPIKQTRLWSDKGTKHYSLLTRVDNFSWHKQQKPLAIQQILFKWAAISRQPILVQICNQSYSCFFVYTS